MRFVVLVRILWHVEHILQRKLVSPWCRRRLQKKYFDLCSEERFIFWASHHKRFTVDYLISSLSITKKLRIHKIVSFVAKFWSCYLLYIWDRGNATIVVAIKQSILYIVGTKKMNKRKCCQRHNWPEGWVFLRMELSNIYNKISLYKSKMWLNDSNLKAPLISGICKGLSTGSEL